MIWVTCLNLVQFFPPQPEYLGKLGIFFLLIVPESSMDFKEFGSLKLRQLASDQAKRQFVLFNDLFQQLDEEQRNSDPEAPVIPKVLAE